jgi:cyclin G-associated kinase
MSSLRGGAGSFMGKIRDTSKAVIQTVQHSMASRDLDLHLITERIAAMSYPAEGMESAMRNHIDDIASILEIRHPNHYAVYNLSERSYNVQKFTTGLVKQPGWTTTRPSGFKIVLETMNSCLEFLKSDPKNVIVIHCLDGKSNTAVLIAGLLMAAGFVKNYKDGLKFFGLKRCDPVLEGHHRVLLRYLETAFTGPSIYMESRVITLTSIVLEPVPMFSKNSDGCRPFIEVSKCDDAR